MKSVLFIIPSYCTGGTISSLISILNSDLCRHHDINTFAIVSEGEYRDVFARFDIGHNRLTTAYRIHRKNVQLFSFPLYVLVRMIDIVSSKMRLDFDGWINRRTYQKILKTKDYDTIVAFSEGLATSFVSKMNHPKKIAWIHCDYQRCVKDVSSELEMYLQFKKIVCVSDYTRKTFLNIFPSLSNKSLFIHNLIDVDSVIKKSLEELHDKQFDISRFSIVSIGRISSVKRFSLIPQIASNLREWGASFNWYIIGPADEKKEYEKLLYNQNYYSTVDCVHILGAKKNPYPYLKKSSLLVSLSTSEACPMVFNEAKILKVPILSTDFGSSFEFINQGVDGYITTIENLSEKLFELIEHEDELRRVRQNNYVYDNSCIINQIDELIEL